MKKLLFPIYVLFAPIAIIAADPVELLPRSESRQAELMDAFAARRSHRSYQSTMLSLQDLSDVVWAACGINRENGKLTAPTAQNSQDVDLYVMTAEGTYLYVPAENLLEPVSDRDLRPLVEGGRPTGAPVCLLLVSDMSRYGGYGPDSEQLKHYYEMGAVDAGIVSQNISLFCAGAGLATLVRAGMDHDGIRQALGLGQTRVPWLNMPVGYPAE